MNYAGIIKNDIANGPGIRTSLFVSGCRNNCPGCFNKEQQDFNYGEKLTKEVEKEVLDSIDGEHYKGLSILGGDPMEYSNAEGLLDLITEFHKRYPDKDVWVYTGYLYEFLEQLNRDDPRYILLKNTDVLVDGRFVLELKDFRLRFRGSSNQRILKLKTEGDSVKIEKDISEEIDKNEF